MQSPPVLPDENRGLETCFRRLNGRIAVSHLP